MPEPTLFYPPRSSGKADAVGALFRGLQTPETTGSSPGNGPSDTSSSVLDFASASAALDFQSAAAGEAYGLPDLVCLPTPSFPNGGPQPPPPLPSAGSWGHFSTQCKPCAWFHHPQGCHQAHACHFCHVCPPGEIKRRKKIKQLLLKRAARRLEEEEEDPARRMSRWLDQLDENQLVALDK